jgi:hypothetical protein
VRRLRKTDFEPGAVDHFVALAKRARDDSRELELMRRAVTSTVRGELEDAVENGDTARAAHLAKAHGRLAGVFEGRLSDRHESLRELRRRWIEGGVEDAHFAAAQMAGDVSDSRDEQQAHLHYLEETFAMTAPLDVETEREEEEAKEAQRRAEAGDEVDSRGHVLRTHTEIELERARTRGAIKERQESMEHAAESAGRAQLSGERSAASSQLGAARNRAERQSVLGHLAATEHLLQELPRAPK